MMKSMNDAIETRIYPAIVWYTNIRLALLSIVVWS